MNYKQLEVNGSPGTLVFKINEQQLADPIPRCYSYEYVDPPSIKARFPLKL